MVEDLQHLNRAFWQSVAERFILADDGIMGTFSEDGAEPLPWSGQEEVKPGVGCEPWRVWHSIARHPRTAGEMISHVCAAAALA